MRLGYWLLQLNWWQLAKHSSPKAASGFGTRSRDGGAPILNSGKPDQTEWETNADEGRLSGAAGHPHAGNENWPCRSSVSTRPFRL